MLKNKKFLKKYVNSELESKKNSSTTLTLSEPVFNHKEIISSIDSIINLNLSQGKKVKTFEKNYSRYIGTKYGIAVNSGSSANLIAIAALIETFNIKKGDEVIIPAATFATVAMPIIQLGLVPVYVDVSKENLNIDPKKIEKSISKKTKILMIVHTLGLACDMKAINKIVKKHKLILFEDCCEAHGSMFNNKKVGSFGHISAFSFFVAHNMTTGEGGMILTNNSKLDLICRSIREFGRINFNSKNIKSRWFTDDRFKNYDKRYIFQRLGYNMRMTEINASFGIEQLKKLDKFNAIRIKNAKYLNDNFKKFNLNNYFNLYVNFPKLEHTYYGFPILIKEPCKFSRYQLISFLEENNVQTRPLFAGNLPDQPGLRKMPKKIRSKLSNTLILKENLFFIGVHPMISKRTFDRFINLMVNFTNNYK